MLHHDQYGSVYKSLQKNITKKFDYELKKINQDIFIQDLFIYPVLKGAKIIQVPEKYNIYKDRYHHLVRLTDHIEFLANIANTYHQTYFSNCPNKITRMPFSEFSFYTHEPMDEQDFSWVFEEIIAIAKKQHSNVHLVLSSLSVVQIVKKYTSLGMINEKRLLNICLYVQCGKEPKIDVITKAKAFELDFTYEGISNFHQGNENNNEFIGDGKIIISNKPYILIETAGGARYFQFIEICNDHFFAHAKNIFTKQITTNIENDLFIIPDQVNHLISSNRCQTYLNSMIAETAFNLNSYYSEKSVSLKKNDKIKSTDLSNNHIMRMYPHMSIDKIDKFLRVSNPPFGCDYFIVAANEIKLCSFKPDFKKIIEYRNNRVKNYIIKSRLESNPLFFNNVNQAIYESEINQISIIKDNMEDDFIIEEDNSYFKSISINDDDDVIIEKEDFPTQSKKSVLEEDDDVIIDEEVNLYSLNK